jgi:hypothetical protein
LKSWLHDATMNTVSTLAAISCSARPLAGGRILPRCADITRTGWQLAASSADTCSL